MSQSELDRFAEAMRGAPAMAEDYARLKTAAEVAARMRCDGYDITVAEVEEAARRGGETPAGELDDAQLDGVSGGSILLPLGIGAGIVAFCSLPALGMGLAAVGVHIARKLGAKID